MSNYDIAYIFRAIDKFSPAVKEMSRAMEKFHKSVDGVDSKFKKFDNAMKSLGTNLFKYVTLPLAGAAVYALKNAEQFKKMEIGLIGVTGSAANAAKLMKSIEEMSMSTGLAPEALTQTAKSLKAAGYSMDQLNEKMRQMSVFAVGSGKDIETVSQIFVRMKTTGASSARMMTMLAKAGIPMLEAFQKHYKLSDKAMDVIRRKGIDIKLLEPVLTEMTKKGSAFYESYQKMLMTTGTSGERIHNILRIMAADFGESLTKAFGIDNKMFELANRLQDMREKFKAFEEANPNIIKMISYAGMLAASLSGIAFAARAIAYVIGGLRIAFAGLSQTILPVVLATYALTKAVLLLKGIDFSSLGKEFGAAGQMIKEGRGKELAKALMGSMGAADASANLSSFIGMSPAQNVNVNVTPNGSINIPVTQGGKTISKATLDVGHTAMAR